MAIALKFLWHFILKLEKRDAVINKVVLPISLIYNLTFKFLHDKSEIVIIQSSYLYISKTGYTLYFYQKHMIGDCHARSHWYLPDYSPEEEQGNPA